MAPARDSIGQLHVPSCKLISSFPSSFPFPSRHSPFPLLDCSHIPNLHFFLSSLVILVLDRINTCDWFGVMTSISWPTSIIVGQHAISYDGPDPRTLQPLGFFAFSAYGRFGQRTILPPPPMVLSFPSQNFNVLTVACAHRPIGW